jgi:hypothetical protein
MSDCRIAFALGGLAGNNAHGAGFLQAALKCGVQPQIISCTSGQILWVSRYLKKRDHSDQPDLRQHLKRDLREIHPTGNINMDLASIALIGKHGVFRPARWEYLHDLAVNWLDTLEHVCTDPWGVSLAQETLELFPCRILVPDFSNEFYEDIADSFNHSDIGIVFNSYDPRSGEERVYMNPRARQLLRKSSSDAEKYSDGTRNDYRDRTTYCDIDRDSVRDGLWLYQYGFDQKDNTFLDGAYFRGLILSELTCADTIFAVRPINHCWLGHLPRNYPESEDLKTEIGFDGSYCGERYQIELVNKLLRDGAISGQKYHPIDLREIEIEQPRGYFDYLFEDPDVFEDAYKQGLEEFEKLRMATAPNRVPPGARPGLDEPAADLLPAAAAAAKTKVGQRVSSGHRGSLDRPMNSRKAFAQGRRGGNSNSVHNAS